MSAAAPMRILYLCHRFPFPPRRGGKIRPFNMIRHLTERHDVTVCSLARSPAEAEEACGIAPYCARFFVHEVRNSVQGLRMITRLPTPAPSSMGYFHSTSMARRIRSLLADEQFDLVFVHCSSVAQYVASYSARPKILDFGDMDSQKWLEYARFKPFPLSLGYRVEGIKMLAEEKRLARRFDLCTATTRGEWETLESYGTGTPTDWFPNGVDSEYFAPGDERYESNTICFVGRMDYYPNQECMFDFCATAWPRLREHRPNLKLLVVGADPSPSVRRLGDLPGVTVTGSVPDVRPYLQRAALMVAPLNIARGTQNKILEAMAQAIPVVTSPAAAKGVDALAGEHFIVARDADEFVISILRILEDPAERTRLAHAGRDRMQSHHDWKRSMRRLDTIIDRCLAMRREVSSNRSYAAQPH
jgi:hypothetical protein